MPSVRPSSSVSLTHSTHISSRFGRPRCDSILSCLNSLVTYHIFFFASLALKTLKHFSANVGFAVGMYACVLLPGDDTCAI